MAVIWLITSIAILVIAIRRQSKGLFLVAMGTAASALISALSHDITTLTPVWLEMIPIAMASFLAALIDEPEIKPVTFTETAPAGVGGTIATALTDADEKGEAIVLWCNTEWKASTPPELGAIQKNDKISIVSMRGGKLLGTRLVQAQ